MFHMHLLVLPVLVIASSFVQSAPTCTNVALTVITQPVTVKVPLLGFDLTSLLGAINGFAGSILINIIPSTKFTLVGTYCEPEVFNASRTDTLQLLIHGATYTRDYWFGLHQGDQYSWVATASNNGYPVLAIDRLGNGQSDHPDPTFDTQYPLQAEVVHQIILQVRAGTAGLPRLFKKVIMSGHSYGSIIANAVNYLYPTDVDATILTGFSAFVVSVIPAILVQALPLPADLQDPRYSSLSPLYVEVSSKAGLNTVFYGPPGSFDQNVQDFDYATRGTTSAGEAATLALSGTTAHGYTAPVYFISGEEDHIFCDLAGLPLNTITYLAGFSLSGCQTGNVVKYLQYSQPLYPDTSSFSYYSIPNAGHCWHLHYAAQAAFNIAHQWMTNHGF